MSMIAKIVCPNCDFTTKIPQQHITASKKIARCPKCGQKFALNNKNIIWTTLSDSAPPTPSNDADSSIPEKEVLSENKQPHHLGKHASAEFNSAKQTSSPKIPKQIYRGGAKGVARDVFFFFIINILVQMWQQSIDSEIIKVVIFWVAFIILFFLIGAYVQKKRFRHGLLVAIIVSLFSIHSIIRSDTDGLARIFFIIGVHFFMLIGIGLSKLVIKSDQHSQKAGRIAKIGFAALILVLFIGAYVTPILPAYMCRINQAEGPNQANKALVDAVESNNKHFSKYGRYAYDMRELNEFGYSQSQYPEMEIKIITVMDNWYLLLVLSKISDGQTEKYFFSNDENRLIPIDSEDIIFTPEDRHNPDVKKYTEFSLAILNDMGLGADEVCALGLVAITDEEAVLYFQYREIKKEWRGFFLNTQASHYVVYDLKSDMPRFRAFLMKDVKGKKEQIISDFRKLARYDLGAE